MDNFTIMLLSLCAVVSVLSSACFAQSPNFFLFRPGKEQETTYFQNPGCSLGGKRYDLDETWHPNLYPDGVAYCVVCSCQRVVKKSEEQPSGKVKCDSISSKCPDVSLCPDTAIKPPKSCCKICPTNNEFRSLLTSRLSDGETGDVVAQARLVMDVGTLFITIDLSRNIQPTSLRLYDETSRALLFKKTLANTSKQICASWDEASTHMEKLALDKITMVLSTDDGHLRGQVTKSTLPVKDTFRAIFPAMSPLSYGASIMMGMDLADNSLHLEGLIDAFPSAEDAIGKKVTVQIFRKSKEVFSKSVALSAGGLQISNRFEAEWAGLSSSHMKQLAKGKLTAQITVPSTGQELTADILPWTRCGKYVTLISGADALPPVSTASIGSGVVGVGKTGHIEYALAFTAMESRLSSIVLDTETEAGDRKRIVKITKGFDRVRSSHNGLAIGKHEKASATDLQLLAEEKLYVSVAMRRGALRGQIRFLPYHSSINISNVRVASGSAGVAASVWCGTNECELNCQVLVPRSVVGPAVRPGSTKAYFTDSRNRKQLLAVLDRESLILSTVPSPKVLEFGKIDPSFELITSIGKVSTKVSVPEECVKIAAPIEELPQGVAPYERHGSQTDSYKLEQNCMYDEKFFNDGDLISPPSQPCVTCSCVKGRVNCDEMKCPPAACADPVMMPGECCPVCPAGSGYQETHDTCYFSGDQRYHVVGARWNPYMHPTGYSKCAICYCKPGGGAYSCEPAKCPKLTCASQEAYRPDGGCCRVCPSRNATSTFPISRTTSLTRSPQGDNDQFTRCTVGRRSYANGQVFHPKLASIGFVDCAKCKCMNGDTKCKVLKCDCKKKTQKTRCCRRRCGTYKPSKGKQKKVKGSKKSRAGLAV